MLSHLSTNLAILGAPSCMYMHIYIYMPILYIYIYTYIQYRYIYIYISLSLNHCTLLHCPTIQAHFMQQFDSSPSFIRSAIHASAQRIDKRMDDWNVGKVATWKREKARVLTRVFSLVCSHIPYRGPKRSYAAILTWKKKWPLHMPFHFGSKLLQVLAGEGEACDQVCDIEPR